jgi:hypothetical protein
MLQKLGEVSHLGILPDLTTVLFNQSLSIPWTP